MICPKCGNHITMVVDSRAQTVKEWTQEHDVCGHCDHMSVRAVMTKVPVVMRRRECVKCELRFKTYERVDLESYLNREYKNAGIPPKERL